MQSTSIQRTQPHDPTPLQGIVKQIQHGGHEEIQ